MKRNFLAILAASALLTACGGGSGGGDNGGFQPEAPKITITAPQKKVIPNPTSSWLYQLPNSAVSMIDVYASQGSRPLETGEQEVYVQTMASSTADAVIYCFAAETDGCWEEIDGADGEKVKIPKPLGGTPINLNTGRATFAVTSFDSQIGHIDLQISATGTNNSSATEYLRIEVGYPSSGSAYQMRILGPNLINPNVPNQIAVAVSDEAGNPVSNPDANNIIVTATNINGTVLGANGDTGSSVNAKTKNGYAQLSVVAPTTGFLTITAQGDAADNNIDNGIQSLVKATRVIQVTDSQVIVVTPIQITTSTLPNGVVGVPYEFNIPTTGATAASFKVSGNVPPGLLLSNQGTLKGTPTLEGTYAFTVIATGVDGSESQKNLTLKIVKGGLKFEPEQFGEIVIPSKAWCLASTRTLKVTPVGDYTPVPPFEWYMDAADVQTALGENKAVDLRNANGELLPKLQLTVTGNTSQVTMNGTVCRDTVNYGGHAIILGIKDSNEFKFESVLPLVIAAEKYDDGSGGGTGGGSKDPKNVMIFYHLL